MLRFIFRQRRAFSTDAVSVDDFANILTKHPVPIRVVELSPPHFEVAPKYAAAIKGHGSGREQFRQRAQQQFGKTAGKIEKNGKMEITQNSSNRVKPTAVESFASFPKLDPRVVEALKKNNLVTPTAVQSGLFAEWFKSNNDLLVKAQTGTGKSVGYVALMYNEYYKYVEKRWKEANGKFAPSNIIVVPNLILADQLKRWLVLLSESADSNMIIDQQDLCRVAVTEQMDDPGRCNVLIGSGKALNRLLSTNQLQLDNLNNVIVDEADSVVQLLTRYATFKEREKRARHPVPAQVFLEQLINMRSEARFLYASATMNCVMKQHLKQSKLVRPGAVFIEAGDAPSNKLMDTHWECPRSIAHRYAMCDIDDNEALAMQISSIAQAESGGQGIVIVPESVKRLPLLDMLHSFDLPAALVSAYDPAAPTNTVLLGTEMDIRGLDIPSLQYVVVVGECDGGVAGYVHAVGRVGRMGRPGTAYVLVKGETALMRHLGMLRHRLRVVPLPLQHQQHA